MSRKEFENKIAISLKEAKESNSWLRILEELGIGVHEECKRLTQKSLELSKIFAAGAFKVF